ncbi:MAG: hypothetical protein KF727_01950 [Microbacteriaceae bacterium]|nr:hypothetical protein [Microbacteriaceae bacterium]
MTGQLLQFTPPRETREQKRARRELIRDLERAIRPERASRAERALPEPAVPGPFGPGLQQGGYWNLASAFIPPHRATSQHLAGIYPFVADTGIGHAGPVIGADLNADALWHFSPWDAYADTSDRGAFSTNILVLGAYRSGKSAVVKTLAVRSLAFGHQAVVPSDAKGEWVVVAEAVGGTVIRLGGGGTARLNPLDRGPRRTGSSDEQDEQMVRQRRAATLISLIELTVDTGRLTAAEHASIHLALQRAVEHTGGEPTLRHVYTELEAIATSKGAKDADLRDAATGPRYALRRFVEGDLSGLFEDASTVAFDETAPMVVVDTSELFARGDLVARLTQVCTTAWVQAVISDRNARRTRYLIREEGWRDMSSLPALQMYQQWLKLSRHYGISNIVILHKMGDLDAVGDADSQERSLAYSVVGDIENKFIFRTNQQSAADLRARLDMSEFHVEMARQLRQGQFIGYVGQYAYLVDAFATSTAWEYQLFKTDDALLGDKADAGDILLPDHRSDIWATRTDLEET